MENRLVLLPIHFRGACGRGQTEIGLNIRAVRSICFLYEFVNKDGEFGPVNERVG